MAVGDMWRRTLVYFGMADDLDDDYYDDDDPPTRARSAASSTRFSAADDLERGYRERPNVRRLPRRRDDFDDAYAEDPEPVRQRPVRAVASRPRPSEVHLIVPKNFNDAQQIADKFKIGVPVILNLQGAETDLAKRLIDFASGLTYALDGGMQRVADKVFMLTPKNVEVSAEERARLMEKGFFNQY
ncbi:MAG: cell division protein SepF [Thermoleophilia bacterium]